MLPPETQEQSLQLHSSPSRSPVPEGRLSGNQGSCLFLLAPEFSLTFQPLFDLKDCDIKFKLETLMNILRDARHESWSLAAYPDPKTGRPLIGAGFNLDVMETQHIQRNPRNPHQFIEPSSIQLWQAAGLDSSRLQNILDQYDRDLRTWKKKKFRKKIRTHELSPELSGEEATRLLRISAIEAIHNARAYCADFDQLTTWQQMALSQLVFQMGVNLEEFVQFLSTLNDHPTNRDAVQSESSIESEHEHWKAVQRALINSDWARRYTSRAVTVIAMFDSNYERNPKEAERRVRAQIGPLVRHHHRLPRPSRVAKS